MTRPADLVNQVWKRKAMCLSAFRGQAAIKQTLPTGFLGSGVSDPGEGAWSPSSSRPITTAHVVSIRGGIGVYGRSYKMKRTRMRPSRWMMASSVREGGPNSKGFSQSTKGHYRGPRLLPAGRAEKGRRKRIHNRMIMMAWTAYGIHGWRKTTMRTFVPQSPPPPRLFRPLLDKKRLTLRQSHFCTT